MQIPLAYLAKCQLFRERLDSIEYGKFFIWKILKYLLKGFSISNKFNNFEQLLKYCTYNGAVNFKLKTVLLFVPYSNKLVFKFGI